GAGIGSSSGSPAGCFTGSSRGSTMMVRMSAPISISCFLRFSLGNPASGSGLRKNLPAGHIRAVNFPVVVTNGDVLEHRIATVIERVRDNLLALVGEAGID